MKNHNGLVSSGTINFNNAEQKSIPDFHKAIEEVVIEKYNDPQGMYYRIDICPSYHEVTTNKLGKKIMLFRTFSNKFLNNMKSHRSPLLKAAVETLLRESRELSERSRRKLEELKSRIAARSI